jgi:hypothetical protein
MLKQASKPLYQAMDEPTTDIYSLKPQGQNICN